MIKEHIGVVKGFQTSINIAYDLHDESKVKAFIPTVSSIDIVEDVLYSVNNSNASRARLLVGAYGRGKSHIVLVLMSLLMRKEKALFEPLLNKMSALNPELHEYALGYFSSEKKLLPVIVSGNSSSLTQSFLNALQQTLRNENLLDLMPDTNFIAAINAIELWKNEYPKTYSMFIDMLGENISEFMASLEAFDVSSYENFIKLYPTLTSGSEFNPFVGFNVVELYEKVIEKLESRGYDGVYIIYDEFSKYLESSIANATVSDTKLLQDFAEKCDRSGNKQMHLMLISHKDISNYIDDNLPKDKVDGWRGVSGRFKHISLRNNFSQMYEIISAVIKKDKGFWEIFCEENNSQFEDIERRFVLNGILEADIAKTAVRDCYPLHPISTFILPRLSEKIAQNERTLFTFLSAEHRHTLPSFLETAEGDFPILLPDYIYDYFEPLLRKEHYTSDTYKLYKLTSRVLEKVNEKSLGAKVIKTIALMYAIEQFEKLPPTYDRIVDTFRNSVENISEVEQTLEYLIDDECIVYHKRSNGYLKIKDSSGVDVQSEINNTIEKLSATLRVKNILNDSVFDSYMYPTAYNDEMEITRYFNFTFIDSEEFFSTTNWEHKLGSIEADGAVYAIIPKSREDIANIKRALKSGVCNNERIIFVLPKQYTSIEEICFEYSAVKELKGKVNEDALLSDEYEVFIEDLEDVIGNFIFSYARPEVGGAEYYYNCKKLRLHRKAQLSAKLSEICYLIYPHTPIINNESINKDTLQTVAINSRNKLLAGLIENELDVNLGLTGTGQDVSFMRSTLVQTGILRYVAGKTTINLNPDDEKMRAVLSVINDFICSANSHGRNFKELYDVLTLPVNGYGIKKGVISIFIAAVMHQHKKYIVIKNKTDEVQITPDLFNSINEEPQNYTIFMESWSEEKTQYIEVLASMFSDYISEKEKDYNTFSYIVFAMSRWYMSLPRYAKELKEIYGGKDGFSKKSKSITNHVKFLQSLKQPNINAREFLFEKLFEIYKISEFAITITENIAAAKKLFDEAKAELVKTLIADVSSIFCNKDTKRATFPSIIKDWYESLKPTTVNHLFANNEDKVLQLMASVSNDEKSFIKRLAKAVTGLRIDDWDKQTIYEFLDYLSKFKETVLEFDSKSSEKAFSEAEIYKLAFVDASGTEVVKTFEKTEYTDRAKLLLNAITVELEEMGQAISEQEKRQVLMELLENMC